MYATILVALDGSPHSLAGGDIALTLARRLGAKIVIVHVYDARLHSKRFTEMEPVLPERYSDQSVLDRVRHAHLKSIFLAMEIFGKAKKPSAHARLFLRLHRVAGYIFLAYFIWISWICVDLMDRLAQAGRPLDVRGFFHGFFAMLLFSPPPIENLFHPFLS